MKKIILAVFILTASLGFSQGISFEQGSWGEVLQKSKDTGKPIFVDVYTTWCGPCKRMAKDIFPMEEVGNYFNANFVCYQIDAEKGEGLSVAKTYSVNSYPTYIFVKADGTLFYKSVGSMPAESFINEGKKALDEMHSAKSLEQWDEEYQTKKNDTEFLKAYIDKRAKLQMNNSEQFDEYLKLIPDSVRYSDEVILLYEQEQYNLLANSYAFNYLHNNLNKYLQKIGFKAYNILYASIQGSIRAAAATKNDQLVEVAVNAYEILPKNDRTKLKEELYMDYFKRTNQTDKYIQVASNLCKEWMNISIDSIDRKDSIYADKLEMQIKTGQLAQAGIDSSKYDMYRAQVKSMYRNKMASNFNNFAWSVFQNSDSKSDLEAALTWSARSLELNPENPGWMDTYANILYKLGRKDEAISTEEKAMKLAGAEDAESFQTILDKMKAGEKTW